MLETIFMGKTFWGGYLPDNPLVLIDPSNLDYGTTSIYDVSGNNNIITNYNDVWVDNTGPEPGTKSLFFDYREWRYLTIGWSGDKPNLLVEDFTIDFWWKPDRLTHAYQTIFGQWKQAVGLGGILFTTYADHVDLHFGPYSEGNSLIRTVNGNKSGWSRHTFVRQSNLFKHYINGNLVTTVTTNATRQALDLEYMIGAYLNREGSASPEGGAPLSGWLTKFTLWTEAFDFI